MLPQLQPFRGHKARSQPLWPGEIPKRFAFRQQHQQRALAELHVAVRAGHSPATQHRGHLQPRRQLALNDKACGQSTRAVRPGGGEAVAQQYPVHAAAESRQSCERHLRVSPAASASDIPAQRKTNTSMCSVDMLGKDLVLACLVYCAIKFAEMIGL